MNEKKSFKTVLDTLAERSSHPETKSPSDREVRGSTINIQFVQELMYALEAVSLGTHQLLYFAGMKYAKNHLDVAADTVQEAAAGLADRFDTMNLGTLSYDGDAFRLEENALTMTAAESEKPLCYFISGYIAGYLENGVGANYVVNEVECRAQGSDACRFEIHES